MLSAVRGASLVVWRSPAIFGLCAVTCLFEASMYVFVLLWTPALRALDGAQRQNPEEEGGLAVVGGGFEEEGNSSSDGGPPLGIVFATFMVCCMLGTSIFAVASASGRVSPAKILVVVLALSSASCLCVARTSDGTTSYLAMLAFEMCVGAYYPAMSTVKAGLVPEDQRAAIYSVFRLPLNLLVLLNLLSPLGFQSSFGVCACMLVLATVQQLRVMRYEAVGMGSQVKVVGGGGPRPRGSGHPDELPLTLKAKDSNVVDTEDNDNLEAAASDNG